MHKVKISKQFISFCKFIALKAQKMINKLLFLGLLLLVCFGSYIPEVFVTTSIDFVNKQLSLNGEKINKFLNDFQAPNITYDNTVDLIHIKMNLSNITQQASINWNTHVLEVTGNRSMAIHAKNISITIVAKIFEYHIVTDGIGQKGELEIKLENINMTTECSFVRNNCTRGIGFGLKMDQLILDQTQLKINITFKNKNGKPIDKRIIAFLQKQIISRGPKIINAMVKDSLNEAIYNATCNGMIEQIVPIGHQTYIISVNTTDVPYFANQKILSIPLDINFQNQKTNATNQEVDNENLVQDHVYEKEANLTATISSNMLDTLVWLIDDSNYLSFTVNKDTLGPDAPISLDTTGLSILMPELRKFPGKDVIVRVNTSSEFSEVFIRSGRLLSGFSVSADFIINDTNRIQNVTKCIELGECFVAVSLNITLGISTSVRLQKVNYLTGLIQAMYIHEIKVINSLIDVKVDNLMKILNPLIASARPQINNMLQQGFELKIAQIEKLKTYNITGFTGQAFLDYASVGIRFDL